MKISKLILLLLIVTATACNRTTSHDTRTADFDSILYTPQYASGFNIKGADGKKSVVITADNPWQGADSITIQLFIARNGENAPDGFTGQIIQDQAKRIVTMSSTHIAMLDALGETSRIAGVSGIDYITNPEIQNHRDSIADIGYEGNVNYELLVSLAPDLVLLYGVNSSSQMESKLNELGIPYFYIGDYLEESPLGKAEWMVAIAEIAGMRERGEKIFSDIPARYNDLKERIADNRIRRRKPKVMLNIPYGDTWFMPPADSYMVKLIEDAGGEYAYPENNGTSSVPIDLEKAYMLVSESDVWLNTGNAASLKEIKEACPKFTTTACYKNGMVYNNTLRTNAAGGNDFFESAIMCPDVVLRDLIKIFYPDLVKEDFVYYRRLE